LPGQHFINPFTFSPLCTSLIFCKHLFYGRYIIANQFIKNKGHLPFSPGKKGGCQQGISNSGNRLQGKSFRQNRGGRVAGKKMAVLKYAVSDNTG
jgi:hypothetical protein